MKIEIDELTLTYLVMLANCACFGDRKSAAAIRELLWSFQTPHFDDVTLSSEKLLPQGIDTPLDDFINALRKK